MIKESIIFEGTPGDDITDCIIVATSKAKELNEDVFIRWNGATVRISPDDDENDILSDYDVELKKIDLYSMRKHGELFTKTELAKKIAFVITKFLSNY